MPNELVDEESPYLQQHAHNPVDWHAWGREAFEKSKRENKPIFLSIGYSTCHWCHVMEKESFSDEDVARLINDTFVPIKVDREERPDIDQMYMNVSKHLTGRGGWPLNIILTPDKKPFFATTYVPKDNKYGLPGIKELIVKISEAWEHGQEDLKENASQIIEQLSEKTHQEGHLTKDVLHSAFEQLSSQFDAAHGGFGITPKFPIAHHLLFLLRYWKKTDNHKALQMVTKTLKEMRHGAMYDHIGFGFHRYSTDQQWRTPHFEKMLYDQALMIMTYAQSFVATGEELFARTAKETCEYVLRELQGPHGGFYSAQDADTEGQEGKYYRWTRKQIADTLTNPDAFIREYNIGEKPKENHIPYLSGPYNLEENIRRRLLERRDSRVKPFKDTKVLADWNGLMIAALAIAGRSFGDRYTNAAKKGVSFILKTMYDGNLYHRYKDSTDIRGFSSDYASVIWGLLEVYQTTFDEYYLEKAIELQERMIQELWDDGFIISDHKDIIMQDKEYYDGSIPSSNSIALYNLLRLHKMTGKYKSKINALVDNFAPRVQASPSGYTFFLNAFDYHIGPTHEIIIVGRESQEMVEPLFRRYQPNLLIMLNPESRYFADYVRKEARKKTTAYVCRDYACLLPTSSPKKMIDMLS